MLSMIYDNQTSVPELSSLIHGLIRTKPFIPATELFTLIGSGARHHEALHSTEQVVFVPDLGLFERRRLRELEAMAGCGTPNVSALRTAVVERFGPEVADALTIRLLSQYKVVPAAA
jgi:hypothetical protein